MKHLFIVLGTIFLLSCTAGDTQGSKHVYWVNSTKASCVGMAPTKCLQVQRSEMLDPTAWESFHAPIKGFEYEPGYIYKLLVKERFLDPDSIPADASSNEYTLVEILERKQDMKLRINDTWVAIEINGEPLSSEGDELSLPQLEINVGEMRYMGNDGCNQYNGGIIELDDQSIRFGIAAGTRMMCQDMSIPDLFNTIIPEVQTWKIKENTLLLFNADGKELMQLRKTD